MKLFYTALFLFILHGSKCEEDIARGKPAKQSTTIDPFTASIAVRVQDNRCDKDFTHTNNEPNPWWAVDLQGHYTVSRVRIQPRYQENRNDAPGYVGNFDLMVGDYNEDPNSTFSICASYTQDLGWPDVANLECGLSGKSVAIRRYPTVHKGNWFVLCICRVNVYGECQDWYWGDRCNQNCSSNCLRSCNKQDGSCTCKSGATGGPRCDLPCPENCGSLGCGQERDPHCKDCILGKHGLKCTEDCPRNCRIGGQYGCEQNGECAECAMGYYGRTCEEKCSENCQTSYCENSGACLCKPGFMPPTCTNECTSGKFGQNCSSPCSENCVQPKTCRNYDGQCECRIGFQPPTCHQQCAPGTYGQNCVQRCGRGCAGGTCDLSSGTCRCTAGYHGDKCEQECSPGTFGSECKQRCSDYCTSPDSCHHVDGSCLCEAGYYPPLCQQACKLGEWGQNCSMQCSQFCIEPGQCGHLTGNCSCQEGYRPDTCLMAVAATASTVGAAAGGAVSAVLLIGLVVGLLVFWRIRRQKQSKSSSGNDRLHPNNNYARVAAATVNDIQLDVEASVDNPAFETQPQAKILYENVARVTVTNSTEAPYAAPKKPAKPGSLRKSKTNIPAPQSSDADITYENLGVAVSELPKYVRGLKIKEDGFQNEFKQLPSGLTAPAELGNRKEIIKTKNRFKNILPYDHSRVKLTRRGSNNLSEYINANFINAYNKERFFIAAQGPVETSVEDFIRMLWEQNVPLVVMVTRVIEGGKTKCVQYWPTQTGTEMECDGIKVALASETQLPHYSVRVLTLYKGEESRQVQHIQYTTWPDHGVPSSPAAFLDFHERAHQLYKPTQGPTVVHCSAGVGRTGTFIAVDYLLEEAGDSNRMDVFGAVRKMREQRVNMVQTLDQYIFIYECVLEALHCGQTMYPASSYSATWRALDPTVLYKQYEMLEIMKPVVKDHQISDAKNQENMMKNRSPVVPTNNQRPLLMTYVANRNNYINAVFVNGYQRKAELLVTQSPLADTVVDFWRLVVDYKCSTLVALNAFDSNDCVPYLREQGESNYGPFSVWQNSQRSTKHYTYSDVTCIIKKQTQSIARIQLLPSQMERGLPTPTAALAVYEEATRWHRQHNNARCLVHCSNGADISGVFVALWLICEQITNEQEVNIFHAVKQIRMARPQFILDKEQYKWLHEVAELYINSFSTYANFQ